MLSSLQNSLIEQAKEKHKKIFPINGKTFQEKHFTGPYKGEGAEWLYFWFNTASGSSGMVRQQINCPQCENELVDNHCACEMRGI